MLIEGGGTVLGEAFAEDLVDEVQFYLTPHLAGGPVVLAGGRLAGATTLAQVRYERVGRDLLAIGTTRFNG